MRFKEYLTEGKVKGLTKAIKLTKPYVKSGDYNKFVELDDESFMKIPGTNKGDFAFFHSKDKIIYLNIYRLATHSNPEQIISHEIGHAVLDRLAKKKEHEIVDFWDDESIKGSLSGSQKSNPSEGLAELFAIYTTDRSRFKRILKHNPNKVLGFDKLLRE